MVNEGLQAAEDKMRREGVPDAAIATFRHYYEQLVAGESGMLPDSELEPIDDIREAEALPAHPDIASDLPADFIQNKEPKVRVDDLHPVEWEPDPELEWCPPGHGDIYTALLTSGTLEQMLDAGYEYAFISNSDNLGAVLDPRILAWFAREEIPFLMEVTPKTEADRKGGHPARLRESGQLILRETAQTPDEDQESFRDIGKWTHVNTNNLWVDLRRLGDTLRERDGVLGLPMIVNKKTVDPS